MADTKLKVQIQFQATGDKELARAFKTAAIANEKLAKSVKKNEKLQDKLNKTSILGVRNNRLLANSFATLRSKMLLASFGFTLISGSVGKFIQKSAEFEKVKVRLNAMFGSVERGTEAFNTFNKIAATTPFTLQDVVEAGATLKAFGADAEELIKPVSDLAAFMGTTATEAAAALGRAFAGGAGAADILRERGILQLVKDSQGIKDLTKITLPEFRAALEKTITDPSVGVAGATDKLSKTLSGLFSNLADSFTRLMAALGDIAAGSVFRTGVSALTTLFGSMAESLKEINKSDIEKIAELRKELGLAAPEADKTGDAFVDLLDAQKAIGKDKTLVQSTNDLKVAQQDLLNALLEKQRIDKENEKTFNKQSTERVKKDIINARERVKVAQQEISAFTRLGEASDKFRKSILGDVPNFFEQLDLVSQLSQGLEKGKGDLKVRIPGGIFSLPEQLLPPEETEKLNKMFSEIISVGDTTLLQLREEMFSEHLNRVLSMAQQNLDARKNAELQALRDTDAFRNASAEERESMEKDALKKFQSRQKILFRLNQLNEIAKVIMATQSGIAEITLLLAKLKAAEKYFMGTGQFALAANARSQMVGLGRQIGFTKAAGAAQIGIIAGQQAPAFARGGSFITEGQQMIMVGDNAGGRERVDITPLSTPDFGDAGGGGSINVNIMGNVIGTQEFVRDNLLPEIEDSIRRNLA
jgi:hypothetical protein